MEGEQIKIKFKQTNAPELSVNVAKTATVSELKVAAAAEWGTGAELLKIVFKGKILKDADTLTDLNVSSGDVMHLVKSAPRPDPAAAPA